MEILPGAKRLQHPLLVSDDGGQPEFDLTPISLDQCPSRLDTDQRPVFSAAGDRLDVRVAATHPPRPGTELEIVGVQPPGLWMAIRVYPLAAIGAHTFDGVAILQQHRHERI